jgi:hypothetical protein
MNIKEIINKNNLEQHEMEYVVEEYIFEKKGKRIKINSLNHPIIKQFGINNLISKQIMENELILLHKAFNEACIFYSKKLSS